MAQWNIQKPTGLCSRTGKQIQADEEFYAALVETEDGLQRQDFCSQYWLDNRPDVYCYWKSVMPKPDEKKKMFVDDDMLMAFFERLINETDPEKINFCFVLMLVLMRKRLVKYASSTTKAGSEIWTVRIPSQQRTVEVLNPELTEEQTAQLTAQLGDILQVEFDEQ